MEGQVQALRTQVHEMSEANAMLAMEFSTEMSRLKGAAERSHEQYIKLRVDYEKLHTYQQTPDETHYALSNVKLALSSTIKEKEALERTLREQLVKYQRDMEELRRLRSEKADDERFVKRAHAEALQEREVAAQLKKKNSNLQHAGMEMTAIINTQKKELDDLRGKVSDQYAVCRHSIKAQMEEEEARKFSTVVKRYGFAAACGIILTLLLFIVLHTPSCPPCTPAHITFNAHDKAGGNKHGFSATKNAGSKVFARTHARDAEPSTLWGFAVFCAQGFGYSIILVFTVYTTTLLRNMRYRNRYEEVEY